jgi:hypothetical protein
MKDIARDFTTLFNVVWYRDFPLEYGVRELGRRAEWTTHIAVCVRSAADLLGYFTHFEAGTRTDAVIKDATGRFGPSRTISDCSCAQRNPGAHPKPTISKR